MANLTLLFVCTANSARSQMAEGWARNMAPPGVEVWSAGTRPGTLNPLAVEVMAERGLDISGHRPKALSELPGEADYVVTLCAEAAAECPAVKGRVKRLEWNLRDPAGVQGSEEDKHRAFRTARDVIEMELKDFFSDPEVQQRAAGAKA